MILYTERDVHGTGGFKDGGEGRGATVPGPPFLVPKRGSASKKKK